EPERHLPGDLAAVDVNRDQLAERWCRAWNPRLRIPEPTYRSTPRAAAHPGRRTAAARGALHHLRDLPEVHHAGERETERRVVREPIPVTAADRARERHHRTVDARRRERPFGVHRVVLPQLFAVRAVLWGHRVNVLVRIDFVASYR